MIKLIKKKFLQNNKSLNKFFILLFLYLLSRFQIILYGVIPFGFDHGKDSLAVMDMILNKSPKLIGPWTSIPGLYFGPGWYYLLAPGFLLTNFHPLAGVVTIMLLGIFQLWLINKYFGFMAALIFTSTPLWFMVTTSAWNPFPLTLVTWLILVVFKKLEEKKQSKIKERFYWLSLGFLMASGFHFSTAFAVLYPLLVFISLKIRNIKLSLRKIIFICSGFFIPFLPQLVFELRHEFSEVKGVLAYLTGQVNIEQGVKPSIFNVLTQSLIEVRQSLLPNFFQSKIETYLGLIVLILIIWKSWRWKKTNKNKYFLEFTAWFIITDIWLFLTHYNFWYLFGLMPVAVVFFVDFLKKINKNYSFILIILLIASSFLSTYQYFSTLNGKYANSREFLPIKQQAINLIYEKADGKPFASYQYVPDIYDFSYQYLYFYQAINGKKLPIDFAYQPNIPNYVVQKPDLMKYFSSSTQIGPAEKIFFIVEKPIYKQLLVDWWNRQKYGKIVNEYKLSDDVSVYEATVE